MSSALQPRSEIPSFQAHCSNIIIDLRAVYEKVAAICIAISIVGQFRRDQ